MFKLIWAQVAMGQKRSRACVPSDKVMMKALSASSSKDSRAVSSVKLEVVACYATGVPRQGAQRCQVAVAHLAEGHVEPRVGHCKSRSVQGMLLRAIQSLLRAWPFEMQIANGSHIDSQARLIRHTGLAG